MAYPDRTFDRSQLTEAAGQPPALEAVDLVHRYGEVTALEHVSLTVEAGEFLTILGPSGSGKTTLLRIIGGFETPTQARALRIAGADVLGLPPNHRAVATVFQHYALFPHMSVGQNIEYGLKVRGIPAPERRKRADDTLALVRLSGKYDRRIQQLSGGEKQRVAFARALVTEPSILLLDEPMGALDEKLRREMQVEIRALQRSLGATFIQVTHSQEEALTMSDRIAVVNRGRIEQLAPPHTVFERPATRFVAAFLGMSNLRDGRITAIDGAIATIECGGRKLVGAWTGADRPVLGQEAFFAVHPEMVRVDPGNAGSGPWTLFPATILSSVYRGAYSEVTVETDIGPLTAAVSIAPDAAAASTSVGWRPEDCAIGPAVA